MIHFMLSGNPAFQAGSIISLCSTDVLPLFSAASGRKKQAIAFGDGVLIHFA
jgi:hypothetical protein